MESHVWVVHVCAYGSGWYIFLFLDMASQWDLELSDYVRLIALMEIILKCMFREREARGGGTYGVVWRYVYFSIE